LLATRTEAPPYRIPALIAGGIADSPSAAADFDPADVAVAHFAIPDCIDAAVETRVTHNARGDLVRTVDALAHQILIEYDLRFKKPTRIENALGHVTNIAVAHMCYSWMPSFQ